MLTYSKMHANEVETDENLVRRLLTKQFPEWANLPLQPVRSAGTDNALYRLGTDMAIRMPRVEWAVGQVEKEQKWLPKLAPHLPLSIPTPLAKGVAGEGYPWEWSVYRWLEGENATRDRLADPLQTGIDLAQFVSALHKIDATEAPLPGSHNSFRGVPLASRDSTTRTAIASLHGFYDTTVLTSAWEEALHTPIWEKAPVWNHGDIQSGNLLCREGRLTAVIDFGCLGAGDPACDLIVAWNLFTAEAREVFRSTLQVDEATWARGRGWALSVALIALPYYLTTNPTLVAISRHAIEQVLLDYLS